MEIGCSTKKAQMGNAQKLISLLAFAVIRHNFIPNNDIFVARKGKNVLICRVGLTYDIVDKLEGWKVSNNKLKTLTVYFL